MSKTPVRNVRIPDPLWEKLGKLATKRNTSITALLIEAATLFLDGTKRPKSTPYLAGENDEILRRLEALEADFQSLTEHVNTTEIQVHEGVQAHVQALSERLQALEKTQVPLKVPSKVQLQPLNVDVQKTVQVEVHSPERDAPLTQGQLAIRLSLSDKAVEKARRKGGEYFTQWTKQRDPDGMSWTWKGQGGRGTPLRYVPLD
jgi:hypothetical protein